MQYGVWIVQFYVQVDAMTDRSLAIEVWDEDAGKDDIMGRYCHLYCVFSVRCI